MWLFALLAFIFAGVITLVGIRHYTRLSQTPAYILVPLFLAVYIPYSIVVLVPIDLMSSSQDSFPLFYIGERARLIIWRITYWLAFVLTWAILPVLQSYVESGFHDPMLKLRDSLKRNAKYQLTILAAGFIGFIYMILTSGLSLGSIKSLAIALSHCYTLVLAIWLLGHGLVNIPRNLWTNADPKKLLNHHYKHAVSVSDAYAEAQSRYCDLASEILALAPYKEGTMFVEWVDDLLDDVSTGPNIPPNAGRARISVVPSMINATYLPNLSQRFYESRARLIRHKAEWTKLLKDCAFAEDIIKSRTEGTLNFRFKRTRLSPQLAYFYYTACNEWLMRLLAVVLAAASTIVVWSELTHGTPASLVNLIVSSTHGVVQQIISSLFLGYMCLSATTSLTSIRVFNIYALVYKDSDTSSLLWYAMYACRLTVPLSYNYLTLVSSRESVFEDFLGKSINLTVLGKYFNDWLPRLIILPAMLTLFHFYEKVKDYLGFGLSFYDDDDDEDEGLSGSVIEGRELVNRSLTDSRFKFALNPYDPNISRVTEGVAGFQSYRDSIDVSSSLPSTRLSFDNRRPLGSTLGGAGNSTAAPTSSNEVMDGVKSFFSGLGRQIQGTVDNLRGNGSSSARWVDENYDEDQPLVV